MAQHEIAHLHGALYRASPQVLVGLPLTLLAIFGRKYLIGAIFITIKCTHYFLITILCNETTLPTHSTLNIIIYQMLTTFFVQLIIFSI